MPFNIGPGELIIVLIIALIVVGPGKLPDVGAALGKSIREFRKAATDVKESTSLDAPAPAAGRLRAAAVAAPVAAASAAADRAARRPPAGARARRGRRPRSTSRRIRPASPRVRTRRPRPDEQPTPTA